jgi:hypothetical protein
MHCPQLRENGNYNISKSGLNLTIPQLSVTLGMCHPDPGFRILKTVSLPSADPCGAIYRAMSVLPTFRSLSSTIHGYVIQHSLKGLSYEIDFENVDEN